MKLFVQVWAHPDREAELSSYEDAVLALLPEYGGRVLQRLVVSGPGPTEVHVLELPDEEALAAFQADPRRAALAEEREAAVARTEVLRVHDAIR